MTQHGLEPHRKIVFVVEEDEGPPSRRRGVKLLIGHRRGRKWERLNEQTLHHHEAVELAYEILEGALDGQAEFEALIRDPIIREMAAALSKDEARLTTDDTRDWELQRTLQAAYEKRGGTVDVICPTSVAKAVRWAVMAHRVSAMGRPASDDGLAS